MSQVKFADSIDWRTYRPYMVPRYHGKFTPVETYRVNPWYPTPNSEVSRRYEGRAIAGEKPKYKNSTPEMNSAELCRRSGIGKGAPKQYETFCTPEGNVNLPRQFQETVPDHFLPTSSSLEVATRAVDTRLAAPPARYFNHT